MVSPLKVVNRENLSAPVETESPISSTSSFELETATRNSKTGLTLKSQNYLCAMESKEMSAAV